MAIDIGTLIHSSLQLLTYTTVDIYNRRHVDIGRYQLGNCFESREDADTAAEKVKDLLLSLHDNAENLQDNIQDMVTNTCQALDKGKENVAEATCRFGNLPKLTTEVFDRQDCPEWARYAVVNSKGTLIFFGNKPTFEGEDYGCWSCSCCPYKHIRSIVFDASDWENSLIERPAVLPDWCKVGEWVYIPACGVYMQIKKVEDDLLFDKEYDHVPYTSCTKARPRPYNEGEMRAMVGMPITMPDGAVCLCTAYNKQAKAVIFDNIHWDAQELMDCGCTIDDNPFFVLEHLENGEWVE